MLTANLSKTLKSLRKEQALTLEDVAKRAGTSVAAIHRYEHNWHRFELQTLEKLANALEADIQIKVKRRKRKKRISIEEAHSIFKPLFWDVTLKKSQLHSHLDWLTIRVLEFGTLRQVRVLLQLFEEDKIAESFFRQIRKFSPRTLSAWQSYFESRSHTCTSKSSPKEPVPFLNR